MRVSVHSKLLPGLRLCFFTGFYLLTMYAVSAQVTVGLDFAKAMGGTAGDQSRSITTDATGNIYTTGYFNGTGDFDPGSGTLQLTSAGLGDIFISKLNASGNFVWAVQIGGVGEDIGNAIAVDASGNVFTTGSFTGTVDFDPGPGTFNLTASGGTDIFISKLDASGNFVWAKAIGGTTDDIGQSIALDASDNPILTGSFTGSVDFDPNSGTFNLTSSGLRDIFIYKLDGSGNFVWAKAIGGTDNDSGISIAIDASGNILTTGTFSDTADFDPGAATYPLSPDGGSHATFISKLNASGNFVWAVQFGSRSSPNDIAVDASGNVYTSGFFDVAGDYDPGPAVYIISAPGNYSTYISKLDASGNFVFAKRIGGAAYLFTTAMNIDASGNIYTTGLFDGTFLGLTSSGSFSYYLSKHDALGNFAWSTTLPGTSYGAGRSIEVDNSGNLFVTGAFNGTGDFDPSAGVFNMTSLGATDVFILKLTQLVAPPTITSFTPTSGAVGTSVTITGTNFSTTPSGNTVAFNGTSATVTASTANSIATSVPANATTGKITVTVSGNIATSATDFTVTNGSQNQPPQIIPVVSAVPVEGIVTIDLEPLISDPDGNLNPNSLYLETSVSQQGAAASLPNGSFLLTLDYGNILFSGSDKVIVGVCDLEDACTEQELTIEVGGEIEVHNALSPNGDDKNPNLIIQYIDVFEDTQNNQVTILNRWGDVVFEIKNYNNTDRVFSGLNKNGKELPSGTYFYKIEFSSGRKTKTGYLSLKR